MTNLNALIAQTVETGRAPSAEDIKGLKLKPTGSGDRYRAVGQLAADRRMIGKYLEALAGEVSRGAADHEIQGHVQQIEARFGDVTGQGDDPRALAAMIEYSPKGTRTPLRPDNPEATTRMRDALRDVAAGGSLDAEYLNPNPDLPTAAQKVWKANLELAAKRVTDHRDAGRYGAARSLATELAAELAGDLHVPQLPDPSEAARRPDGSYDPKALADLVTRRP